ncbi:hypothetical protein YTPLAS18_22210 [Nitrospira sp.]|nr:hypothetical protein YTPLAS18_22210 [Nitrospira sp.]
MAVVCLSAVLAVSTAVDPVRAKTCTLPTYYAGMPYPVEEVAPRWTCQVQNVVANSTTANKMGPVRLRIPFHAYDYLLDHPDIAAALVNRLDLGPYKAEMKGPGRFWGTDGEGNQGLVQILHQGDGARMYLLDGTHDGRILPQLRGTAVVLVQARPSTLPDGIETVEADIVAYLQVHNRFIAGAAALLRPMAGALVRRQMQKAVQAAVGLSNAMRTDPDRVLFEATDPPSLPDQAVDFLQATLSAFQDPGKRSHTVTPP